MTETQMPGIRGLIFDLDGVLTDTAEFHYRSWKRLGEEEGIPFTRADNEQLRGVSRRESLNRFLKGRFIKEEMAEQWMARKNRYFQEFIQQLTPEHVLPGVIEFLREAREAGLKLGVGSASKNARFVLERLSLLSEFDAIGDGYSVVNTKPAPDIFIWVAGRMGLSPRQVIVFEDAEAGIEAAKNGGFWSVGLGAANVSAGDIVLPDLSEVSLRAILNVVES